QTARSLTPADAELLHKLFNILEDGHIEARLKQEWPNLAPYIDALNAHLFPPALQPRLKAQIVTRFDADAYCNALLGFAVMDWPALVGPTSITATLKTLRQTAHATRTEPEVARRVAAAVRLCTLFRQVFPPDAMPRNDAAQRKPCSAFRPVRRLPARLTAAVDAALVDAAANGAFGRPGSAGSSTGTARLQTQQRADATGGAEDARLLAEAGPIADRVRRALRLRASRAGTRMQGVSSGQLSMRRLHRIALGQSNVFERRRLDRLHVAIGVLLDCSGSTKRIWRICQLCAVAIAEGLKHADGVTLVIGAYQGLERGCQVTPLYDARTRRVQLNGVSPVGSTPSAEALHQMALRLRQTGARDRILLHFTDGQPDDPGAVRTTLAELAREGTVVWTLAPGQVSLARLQACYGPRVQLLANVNALPQAIAELASAALTAGSRT
ncbi:MAG: vWA domain-containing protein, partial [Dehalococcoidia bacterium]